MSLEESGKHIAVPWMAVGVVATIVMVAVFQPWTTQLDGAKSPARIIVHAAITVTLYVPVSLYCVATFLDEEYRGKPQGQVSPVSDSDGLDTRSVAIVLALALAFGAIGPASGTGIDLPALVAALSAVVLGPVLTLGTIVVGNLVRAALGGLGFVATADIPFFAIQDATNWAISAVLNRC